MNAGKVIKLARTIRGYTQAELSQRYGISESTLRNYEKERTDIPKLTFDGILKHLHLTEEEVKNVA